MKKNKAFTLIEILAVVTIIGLIFILVIPKITTSLKNKKSDVDATTTNLVLSATKLYVSDHSSKFEKEDGNVSCMPLRELVDKGYLDEPVKNVTDDKDITNGKSVRITYDKGFKYELVDSGECSVVYNPPCDFDYCDRNGNGYTQVEYLESTGLQYIDLDYNITPNTKYEMKILPILTDQNVAQVYLGTRYSNIDYWIGRGSVNNYNISISNSNAQSISYNNNTYPTTKTIKVNNNIMTIDNQTAATSVISSTLNESTYLFALNNNGSPDFYSYMRLFHLKMWENDILIRDYIPVIDERRKACLFDKIEKKCYYSSADNDFISPEFNQEINYLVSTGTQYIDLDYNITPNTKYEMKILPTLTSKNIVQVYLGSKDSNSYYWMGKGSSSNYNIFISNSNAQSISYNNNTYPTTKTIKVNNNIMTIDNQTAATSVISSTLNGSTYLFALNNNGSPDLYSYMRLFYLKIWENDILIRDYIPFIDKDGISCLYDKIERKCYYNQGSSEFLRG